MKNLQAKWIWANNTPQSEEYVFFSKDFDFDGEKTVLKLCAETEYVAYINGTFLGFGQYAGYPFEKYYDEYDITSLCQKGKNLLTLTVRYEGRNTATHIDDGAGVIFSVLSDEKEIAFSDESTLCCYDENYLQHEVRFITGQLGNTSTMKQGENNPVNKSVEVEKTMNILPRPVLKAERQEYTEGKPLGNNLYDLGREIAGYLTLKVKCSQKSSFKIAYGEHLDDGNVRRIIGNRDFSLDFEAGEGESEFTQYFVRIAGRYLEAFIPDGVEILSIGVIPYLYPLTEKGCTLEGLDKKIYETSVRTLRLSMNYHYEDCPWREQALYVLDSRNQMLCGYYAFKERDFQRANLVFISKGARSDGFLELTYPAVETPAIPFFSIMYPVAVYEYVLHTGDKTIISEVMPAMKKIMDNFTQRIGGDGLIENLPKPYWNFFEWSEGNMGMGELTSKEENKKNTHIILNCAYIYAGSRYDKLCEMYGSDSGIKFDEVRKGIVSGFFDKDTGLFGTSFTDRNLYSQLCNAFALLAGVGDERTVDAVKNDKKLIPATLSMLGYVYDALLESDFDGNKDFVLSDIREKYKYMLDNGATSFWETIKGADDFSKAGSLCHGWSAMPVYYFNKLGVC